MRHLSQHSTHDTHNVLPLGRCLREAGRAETQQAEGDAPQKLPQLLQSQPVPRQARHPAVTSAGAAGTGGAGGRSRSDGSSRGGGGAYPASVAAATTGGCLRRYDRHGERYCVVSGKEKTQNCTTALPDDQTSIKHNKHFFQFMDTVPDVDSQHWQGIK